MQPLISKFVHNSQSGEPRITEYDIIRIEAFAVQVFAALGAGRSSHDIDLARLLRGVEVIGREEEFLFSVKIMTNTQFDIHRRDWDFEPASPLELISLRHLHYKTGFFNMNEEYQRLRTEFKKTNRLQQVIRSHAAFGLGIGLYYPEFLIPSIDVDTLELFADHDDAGKRKTPRGTTEINTLVLASLCAFEVVPQLARTLQLKEFIERWAPDRYSQAVIHMSTQDQKCLPRRLDHQKAVNVMLSSSLEGNSKNNSGYKNSVLNQEINNLFIDSLIGGEINNQSEQSLFRRPSIRKRALWRFEIGMMNVGLCLGFVAKMFSFDHELSFLLFDLRSSLAVDMLKQARYRAQQLMKQHEVVNKSSWIGKYQELALDSQELMVLYKIRNTTDSWRSMHRLSDLKDAVKLLHEDGFETAMRFIDESAESEVQIKNIVPVLLDAFALGLGIELEYPEMAATLLLRQSSWHDDFWELGRNTYEHHEYRYKNQPLLDQLMTYEFVDRVCESLMQVKVRYPELNRKIK